MGTSGTQWLRAYKGCPADLGLHLGPCCPVAMRPWSNSLTYGQWQYWLYGFVVWIEWQNVCHSLNPGLWLTLIKCRWGWWWWWRRWVLSSAWLNLLMILLVSIYKCAGKGNYSCFIFYKVKFLPFFFHIVNFLVGLSQLLIALPGIVILESDLGHKEGGQEKLRWAGGSPPLLCHSRSLSLSSVYWASM